MRMKEELAATLPDIRSLRDFGGCYLVHDHYLLQAARRLHLRLAGMIDINVTPEFMCAAEELQRLDTRIETVHADFREGSTFADLIETDASLLYEVLLHQENYVEVIRHVCAKTSRFICVAQPCLCEELFTLPAAAALLPLYDDDLKGLLRTDGFWPEEDDADLFTPAHWIWGHTSSHLVDIMRGMGWFLRKGEVVDNVAGTYWDYPLLLFERREP